MLIRAKAGAGKSHNLPCLTLPPEKEKPIGIWEHRHKYYLIFCLQQPQHGYGISQQVRQMTGGELIISAGTMYGTLSKMEKDGLIAFEREEEKRENARNFKKVGRTIDVISQATGLSKEEIEKL